MCNKEFTDEEWKNVICCNICRKPHHDRCLSNISRAAIAELHVPTSRIAYICAQPECTKTEQDEGPLFSNEHANALAKEDAQKIVKAKHATMINENRKFKAELAEATKEITLLKANPITTRSDVAKLKQTIADLTTQLKQARDEAAEALQQRRTSMAREDDTHLKQKLTDALAAQESEKVEHEVEKCALENELKTVKTLLEQIKTENTALKTTVSENMPTAFTAGTEELESRIVNSVAQAVTQSVIQKIEGLQGQINNLVQAQATQAEAQSLQLAAIINKPAVTEQPEKRTITYASVVNANNPNEIRAIKFNDNVDIIEMQNKLRADNNCAQFRLKTRRKKGGMILIGAEATKAAEYMSNNYANEITVSIPKGVTPMLKIVGVPIDQSTEEIERRILISNDSIDATSFKIINRYEMPGKRRPYAVAIARRSNRRRCSRLIDVRLCRVTRVRARSYSQLL